MLALILPIGALFSPVERLILATALMVGVIKCAAMLRRSRDEVRAFSPIGLALYFGLWPGIDARAFAVRTLVDEHQSDEAGARGLFRGAVCLVAGASLLAALSWFVRDLSTNFSQWAAIGALLLCVHFGVGEMLPWLIRRLGFAVGSLFEAPLRSDSLGEFWSRRWNLAFVEMDRILFLRPLRRRLGARGAVLGVFAISGVYHEMGISYPAGAGWGGPILYFLGHGLLVAFVEPRLKWSLARRVLTWLAVLLPLPWLFHEPFRQTLIWPLVNWISEILHARSFDWYLHAALWLGTLAHFCILGASFQVPTRLGWREDFAKLSRFNRKIFWTYGAFIVLCIVSLGTLSGVLHDELFRGDKSAIAISIFIGVFWTARVGTDLFYFKHTDWPRGWQFELGHVLLTFVFSCLAVLFGVVVPWHAWVK